MDYLQQLDIQALIAINRAHTVYLDHLMTLAAGKITWLLMIVVLLWITARKGWKQSLVLLGAIALTILIADQVASSLIKPWVMRLRPTHDPSLEGTIHIINGYRGGMYGFVSSHAGNTLGSALLVMLIVRNRFTTLALGAWVALVCYCRMYQGVHYPGDILGGAVVGVAAALLVFALYKALVARKPQLRLVFSDREAKSLAAAILCNILIITILAIFPQF